ncbi:phage tail protein [Streptococcus uberis]|uniref:major tail protein n=1 Tax=Streptococcus uberis TaxID=1349 RepID=UPI0022B8A5A1|nr:major tail protein [Streptococcus uberis]MCZ8466395.1 phage tail protein [Streptococcus uberis]
MVVKQENKVTYGLENVHIAPITTIGTDGTITYDTVFKMPGAMELKIDPAGENKPIKADNIDFYTFNSNDGYEGKLKITNICQEFLTKILGEIVDETTGVVTEKADAVNTPFAIMFQFEGDAKKTRHVLYYCSASRPSDGSATKDGSSINEPELEFKASPRPLDKVVRRKVTSLDDATVYKDWFTKPYEPTVVGA